jgi:glutamate/tyrosine decarboxylase-like PLP-dependent enzyme
MFDSREENSALSRAAAYGLTYRQKVKPLHPPAGTAELRRRLAIPLPDEPRNGAAVIDDLISAAEPGLVDNTSGSFFAWVMGGSDTTGVAADWLTSIWGQNAAIHQTSPAAAIAEEAAAGWLLDLLDLPRESSVGFVTGATMASFVCLAAARAAVLERHGWEFDEDGLQGAPAVRIFLSDEAHASNLAALRYLGFGRRNLVTIPSDGQGVMPATVLARAMDEWSGAAIVIAQAGQINTGGFDNFPALHHLCRSKGAWLHVDGAFGLWLRTLPEKAHLTQGLDQADSWAVDGHKWLQIPYDSGFAIVRDSAAHRRAMDISAAYLNSHHADGRNPTEFNPELSRRARGFAVWAVLQALGRAGVREIVSRHCRLARLVAEHLARVPGIEVLNSVDANQIIFRVSGDDSIHEHLADRLNHAGKLFVRPAAWKKKACMRLSIISGDTQEPDVHELINEAKLACQDVVAPRAIEPRE